MGKVVGGMTVSLDGFVNDQNGDTSRLFSDFDAVLESEIMQDAIRTTGAVIMGRRSYEMASGDFTGYEFQTPIFVVTHDPPEQTPKGENEKLRFNFVSDGVEHAVTEAKTAAGDRDVTVVGGADTTQQLLRAGLIDELQISIMPVLLGDGTRLLEHLGDTPIKLERVRVVESPSGRTDLIFRVVK